MKPIGHYLNSPFKKWDGDIIVNIINKNGFIFDNEYAGIFDFHHKNAGKDDKFHLNYLLYLRRTILFICNPNIRISPPIKSHKQLDDYLKSLIHNVNLDWRYCNHEHMFK